MHDPNGCDTIHYEIFMRIAILGGSFNPPHTGHALLAQQVKEFFPIDEVWLMPANKHPFEKIMIPIKHRLAMVRFLENKFIKTSTFEIDKGKISYSIDTLSKLQKLRPSDTFYWVIGSDQLIDIKRWKEWETLISSYNFIIFPRPPVINNIKDYVKSIFGYKSIPGNILIADNDNLVLTNISSTIIRIRIISNRSISHMVPEEIEDYIKKHKLYSQ
jgi:nicotinate-nucleotide adenylyltransferase